MSWRGGFNPTYFGRDAANLAISNILEAYLAGLSFTQVGGSPPGGTAACSTFRRCPANPVLSRATCRCPTRRRASCFFHAGMGRACGCDLLDTVVTPIVAPLPVANHEWTGGDGLDPTYFG